MNEILAPYVPSDPLVIDAMLNMAKVIPGERLYDLGAGKGRIVVKAALPPYYARTVGIEEDKRLALAAQNVIKSFNLQKRAEIVCANIFDHDYRDANIVTLYLTRKQNIHLKSKLENELKEDARVVSHDFEMIDWKPSKVLPMVAPFGNYKVLKETRVFLYEMNKAL